VFATFITAVRRVTATTALAGLLAGPPWVLLRFLDQPWPHHLPSRTELTHLLTSPLSDTTLGLLLTGLLWLAWASFAWSAIAELAAALLGLRLPQPRGLTPARGIAALLVALITSSTLLSAASAAMPAQAAAHSTTQHADPARAPAAPAAFRTNHGAGTHKPAPPPPTRDAQPAASTAGEASIGRITLVSAGREYTYTVHRGDTLSDIARHYLGDTHRWPEIFALNRGTHFPHVGGTLTNPNLINPGWTLQLPDDANPPTQPAPPHTGTPNGTPATPAQPPHTGLGPAPTAPAAPAAPTVRPSSPANSHNSTPQSAPPSTASVSPSDPSDGVVPASPATTATATPASTHPTSSHPTNPASPTGPHRTSPTAEPDSGRPHGISLTSGSWLDIGLAAAIAAAVALVWMHRRHRYIPRPVTGDDHGDDPDLAPLPPPINQAMAALRRLGHGDHQPDGDHPDGDDPDVEDERVPDATADRSGDTDDRTADRGRDGAAGVLTEPRIAMPVVPALAHPLAAVWPPAGVGLVGPGAAAATRGFLVAGLAAGGLTQPDARAWVIMPSATAATLLGAAAVSLPATPRLTVTAGLDDALDLLEQQVMHRSRLVYQHETDTVTALRDDDPYEEPLPPVLFLADATTLHERTRIVAVLTQGQRLDIHGVLLGAWPDGNTITVDADGTTRPADGDAGRHGAHPADIGRLSVIDLTEAANLIAVLAESHTGRPQPPAPTEPAPANPSTAHPPTDQPTATPQSPHDAAIGPADPPGAAVGVGSGPVAFTPVAGLTRDAAAIMTAEPDPQDEYDEGIESDQPQPESDQPRSGRVAVTVLGPPQIVGASEDAKKKLLHRGTELLVYLAARDIAVPVDRILEDLIPEAPHNTAPAWLHNYVSSLRGAMRATGGDGTYVLRPRNGWYALDPATIDIDLWRMRAAIKTAAHTDDPEQRLAALRDAVACYRGHLADGHDYLWIESYREGVRRHALDATTALLQALEGRPEEQLAVATAAIGLHPHAESLYQTAMHAHHQRGDLDAIRQLRRDVTAALADLDAEPGPDTLTLADRLAADLQTRPRRTPQPRVGGHP
jgi:DNA-binding SARP family transcriptional activator/LysM repeat protein